MSHSSGAMFRWIIYPGGKLQNIGSTFLILQTGKLARKETNSPRITQWVKVGALALACSPARVLPSYPNTPRQHSARHWSNEEVLHPQSSGVDRRECADTHSHKHTCTHASDILVDHKVTKWVGCRVVGAASGCWGKRWLWYLWLQALSTGPGASARLSEHMLKKDWTTYSQQCCSVH